MAGSCSAAAAASPLCESGEAAAALLLVTRPAPFAAPARALLTGELAVTQLSVCLPRLLRFGRSLCRGGTAPGCPQQVLPHRRDWAAAYACGHEAGCCGRGSYSAARASGAGPMEAPPVATLRGSAPAASSILGDRPRGHRWWRRRRRRASWTRPRRRRGRRRARRSRRGREEQRRTGTEAARGQRGVQVARRRPPGWERCSAARLRCANPCRLLGAGGGEHRCAGFPRCC